MQIGCGFPGVSVPVLRMMDAPLAKFAESPVSASFQGDVNLPSAAEHLRRLLGPRVGAVRRDVLMAADMDLSSG